MCNDMCCEEEQVMTNFNKDYKQAPMARGKVILSQVLACSSLYLLLVDLGMSVSFVTVVIPDLLDAKEGLSLNEYQASWFGSLAFLCQPLGSIFSGPILDYFGRKKALFLVNIPHVVAWLLLYNSWNLSTLFIANALLGIGTGIMEAPSVTYVGEISDPSIRGSLTTLTNMFTSLGICSAYFLGSVFPWRTASLICLGVPLCCMCLVFLVPETPIWLISKNRHDEAIKSLCWLRGWCSPENVQKEFKDLVDYSEMMNQCILCLKNEEKTDVCPHKNQSCLRKMSYKLKYVFFAKETLRPLLLVVAYFAFTAMSGLGPLRPNMINICKAFGMSWDSSAIVILVGLMAILMNLLASILIKVIGKRFLILSAQLGVFITSIALAIYAKLKLNDGISSYDVNTFPEETSTVPTLLFFLMAASSSLAIPWVLLSEVFPFRTRGAASGFAAAGNYVITFIASKTYLELEHGLHIYGALFVYSGMALLGFLYLFAFLPETENKTLYEIENHFSKGSQIIDYPFKNMFVRKTSQNRNDDCADKLDLTF